MNIFPVFLRSHMPSKYANKQKTYVSEFIFFWAWASERVKFSSLFFIVAFWLTSTISFCWRVPYPKPFELASDFFTLISHSLDPFCSRIINGRRSKTRKFQIWANRNRVCVEGNEECSKIASLSVDNIRGRWGGGFWVLLGAVSFTN